MHLVSAGSSPQTDNAVTPQYSIVTFGSLLALELQYSIDMTKIFTDLVRAHPNVKFLCALHAKTFFLIYSVVSTKEHFFGWRVLSSVYFS